MAYLAIQTAASTLVLHDDGDTAAYHMESAAFPAPAKRDSVLAAMRWGARVPGSWDDLAERIIGIHCLGATEADAEDSLLALQRAVDSHRAKLLWRSSAASPLIWTTIRTAEVREESVSRPHRSEGILRVTLTLVTDSEWSGAGIAFSGTDVTVADGDRPARMRLKVTSNSANPLIGLGIKNAPAAGYDPLDTVGSPAAVNLSGTYAALHTAEVKDTAAMRGSHVVVADVATNAAAAASTRYRAVAATTGSGVSGTATATHNSTAALATSTRLTALPGTVDIPAGGVPGIETGSGYASESAVITQATNTGTRTFSNAYYPDAYTRMVAIQQTFAGFGGLVTGVSYTVATAPSSTMNWYLELRNSSGVSISARYHIPVSVGTHKVTFDEPVYVPAGQTWAFVIGQRHAESNSIGLAYGASAYANGALTTPLGTSNAQSTDDLVFTVHGQVPLGFGSTVTVHANCSEGSKTATLSSVTLLPADDFAAVIERAFGANEGVLIEATDPLAPPAVYLTTSTDGTAGPAVAPSAWHGAARLPVGVNKLVVAAKGTVSVSGTYHPCYSNAAAGSL